MTDAWRLFSSCADNPEKMFPKHAEDSYIKKRDWDEARSVCLRCPVLSDCVAWVLQAPFHEPTGMTGAMTPTERASIRKENGRSIYPYPSPISELGKKARVKSTIVPHNNQYTSKGA